MLWPAFHTCWNSVSKLANAALNQQITLRTLIYSTQTSNSVLCPLFYLMCVVANKSLQGVFQSGQLNIMFTKSDSCSFLLTMNGLSDGKFSCVYCSHKFSFYSVCHSSQMLLCYCYIQLTLNCTVCRLPFYLQIYLFYINHMLIIAII